VSRALIVSSDGHAMAKMADYRPYLPSSMWDEFDEFCKLFNAVGFRSFDAKNLLTRTDPDVVDRWVGAMHDTGRTEGNSDPRRRLDIMGEEGIVAEIIFPDFGLPFELMPPVTTIGMDTSKFPVRTREKVDAANRAHNRWLADFCSYAPDRLVPMLTVLFDDVQRAIEEIKWGKEAGFRGLVLPTFTEAEPLFHAKFDPIWSTLEDLDMPANSHAAISMTVAMTGYSGLPHPAVAPAIHTGLMMFRCHEILTHLIWGGVLERHPGLRVCFSEQGSAWVIPALANMDYQFEGSYLRRDVREVASKPPSQYFDSQCFLGSSTFSRAEIEARGAIGVDKMLLGMDYPHHEGTFAEGGTTEYLRATLGASNVPVDEAALMLGENHIQRWKLDRDALRQVADRIGPRWDDILSPPTDDLFARGDVHKPLASSAGSGAG
jgi:predicted TIM-barrel fold metal-dependent hydrolase